MGSELTRAEVKRIAKDIRLHAEDIRKHPTDWVFVATHAQAITLKADRLWTVVETILAEEEQSCSNS